MTTTAAHPRLLVHTSRQAIRWPDMDALGHVNNTVYFRYMEQARIEWLYAVARETGHGYAAGSGAVIVNASCTFTEPLLYPGDVEVRMFLAAPGRTSVASYYEIWKDDRRHADGAAKIVWIDLGTGRPAPLPEPIAAPLRHVLAHPAGSGADANEGAR
jgi:acyl-CoA thioester hydrolase